MAGYCIVGTTARHGVKAGGCDSTALPTKLERITYVEDEADIRAIVEIALAKNGGLSLDLCSSGPEAISRTPQFNPDLIIADVMMPGMDGIETLKRLREFPQLAKTPVIILTGRTMPSEAAFFRSMGAAEVITKPFNPMTLADRIQEIWQRTRSDVYDQ